MYPEKHFAVKTNKNVLLQHCRVLVNSARVEYVMDHGNQSLY
jgi:hypothetical protein